METKIQQAFAFASKAHGNQKYGDKPYTFHLSAVRANVVKFLPPSLEAQREDLETAALLHDTLEDTDTNPQDLAKFGATVTELVSRVTDEEGVNRRERHQKTFVKIRQQPAAVFLKLCDRIANIEECLETRNKSLFFMYQKEHKAFRDALFVRGEFDEVWNHLESRLKQN